MGCPNAKGEPCRLQWCGQCYANLRGRERHKGHRWCPAARRKGDEDVALRRPGVGGSIDGGGGGRPPVGCRLTEGYPTIFEFLTRDKWDDGKARQRGTLLISWSEGRFRCWLNDKDAARSAWVSQETLSDLLSTAEEGLAGDSLEWRRDKPGASRR